MTKKRIALIRYTPDYFLPFGQGLEAAGFEVFWINSLKSDSASLLSSGVRDSHWLDTSADFRPDEMSLDECRERLGALEREVEGPRIYDIIMMDRLLRKKPSDFAIRYLAHIDNVVTTYFQRYQIQMVTSGRDTALQLMSMLICRRLSIPWVVPTRTRIPQEMFGFCYSHDTDSFITIRPPTKEDKNWAEDFLESFRNRGLKPALKKSARNFFDVFRLLPKHADAFLYELKKSRKDFGNDFARYTILKIIKMYFQRRLNMLAYKLSPPYKGLEVTPFALYALHTQPESSIDVAGSYFSDQVHLIRTIARSLPISHELYVKVHPTDVDGQSLEFYKNISKIQGVRLIAHNIDSRNLLEGASLLFALTGTIAYEAGLLGKPVIVFAKNYFNHLPTIHYCSSLVDLPELITKVIAQGLPVDFDLRVIDFLTNLRACCFDGEVNRTYGTSSSPLSHADLATLSVAYHSLVGRLENKYNKLSISNK